MYSDLGYQLNSTQEMGNSVVVPPRQLTTVIGAADFKNDTGAAVAPVKDGTGSQAILRHVTRFIPWRVALVPTEPAVTTDSKTDKTDEIDPTTTAASDSALPAGWTAHTDPSGRAYYYNEVIRLSTFDRPTQPMVDVFLMVEHIGLIRYFNPSTLSVSTLINAGNYTGFSAITSMCVDPVRANTLYIAYSRSIWRLTLDGSATTLIAGCRNSDAQFALETAEAEAGGVCFADGVGEAAQFKLIQTILCSRDGLTLYAVDQPNHRVRRIDLSSDGQYKVSPFAGTGEAKHRERGFADRSALLNPCQLSFANREQTELIVTCADLTLYWISLTTNQIMTLNHRALCMVLAPSGDLITGAWAKIEAVRLSPRRDGDDSDDDGASATGGKLDIKKKRGAIRESRPETLAGSYVGCRDGEAIKQARVRGVFAIALSVDHKCAYFSDQNCIRRLELPHDFFVATSDADMKSDPIALVSLQKQMAAAKSSGSGGSAAAANVKLIAPSAPPPPPPPPPPPTSTDKKLAAPQSLVQPSAPPIDHLRPKPVQSTDQSTHPLPARNAPPPEPSAPSAPGGL